MSHFNTTFYIFIDELGVTIDDSLLKLVQRASKPNNKAIRIFLTGTSIAFGQRKGSGGDLREFPINPKNQLGAVRKRNRRTQHGYYLDHLCQ
ncbi:hypothetical protein BDV38DRAFT_232069 [Aspergillus pseudotamarii]|uniref:Uncharacterized protein n=1 Tax=Aspergillus pseudotamarii TaxID=132259 RepID=A0A5N6TBV4_ASPPS|nr:uncharacterized protein BDV38DRAFT_232069 [Aspergillus pseudotamarii]KAE8143782.1 hypothetical protein BDV38DRAFT_232069 [Aspergillus pseudotamarii]